MIIENLSTLKIHKLTQAQYDRELAAGNIDENALYLTPEEEIDLSPYATIEQLEAKANTSHNHEILDITNLQSTLDGKADLSHTHNYAGKNVEGEVFIIDGIEVTAKTGAEVFNDYTNVATGANSHAEGIYTTASGDYSHAEGGSTTASGVDSHAEGESTTASGDYSHAEGVEATASGDYSHAEGIHTTASGDGSHAEGEDTIASNINSHAEGYSTIASGDSSHAEGYGTTASGDSSHAAGVGTIANDYQYVVGKYNRNTTAPTSLTDTTVSAGIFIVGIGTSDARSNGFRVNPAGKAYATGTLGTSGADYAEYFEWIDGNPNNEDRRGRFVTLDGNKIRYATNNDDYILGVVSAEPTVVGDIQSDMWHNMYQKDIYGNKIVEVVEVPETIDENDIVIPAHIERRWVLNPEYNPNMEYVSREIRPEWDAIGIVGKLVVVDDGTSQVNDYCHPSVDGVATASETKTNYRVIERLDDNHIKIFIK